MSNPSRPSRLSAEWLIVILIPVCTIVAGAVMLHVASSFGFTALGEPVIVEAHDR